MYSYKLRSLLFTRQVCVTPCCRYTDELRFLHSFTRQVCVVPCFRCTLTNFALFFPSLDRSSRNALFQVHSDKPRLLLLFTGQVCSVSCFRWWPTTTATRSSTSRWRGGASCGQGAGLSRPRTPRSAALMAPSVPLMVSQCVCVCVCVRVH